MKTTIRISFIAALLLSVVSCVKETKAPDGVVPTSGEIEYEVSYSKDIVSDLVVGQFLPKSFSGVYNQNGIKLMACCGFGMVKLSMILSPVDSYVDLNIPEERLIMPIESMIIKDSLDAYDARFTVERDDNLVDICGYKSKAMRITISSSETKQFPVHPDTIEIFYVPMDGIDFSIAGVPQFTVPGLITAMKLSAEDSSVILMLSNVKAATVSNDVFRRPADARLATVEKLNDLYSRMQ